MSDVSVSDLVRKLTGRQYILLGFLLCGIAAIVDLGLAEHFKENANVLWCTHLFGKLLSELGVALVVLGGVGVLLEMKHWEDASLEKLGKVLDGQNWQTSLFEKIQKAAKLDPKFSSFEDAREVAIKAILALAGGALGSQERLKTFTSLVEDQETMLGAIANGFKSDVKITLVYTEKEPDLFEVTDTTVYQIHKGFDGKKTVPLVYGAGESEIVTALDIRFEHYPKKPENNQATKILAQKGEADCDCSIATQFRSKLTRDIDHLQEGDKVAIIASYTVKRNALLYWKSEQPIHKYDMTVTVPRGYGVRYAMFMVKAGGPASQTDAEDTTIHIKQLRLENDNWSMPYQGVGWSLVPVTERERAEIENASKTKRTSSNGRKTS